MAGTPPQYYTFKNSPALKGQQLGFTAGKGYYARGALPQAAVSDPYAQLTGYQPLTSAQIQAEAQNEISPIIQAITGQANTQATQQASQINALTQDYANELGQINMASPYQSAEGQQAAVDAALQQSLTGEGSDLAGGLSDRLAALQGSSGAPALQQAAHQLSSQGQSNGTTELANGSAALSNLIANAAAGAGFGEKLPAIAKLSGLQALGQSASQQQKSISDATLQAESQLPSIIQDLTSNNETGLANAVAARQKQQALDFDNAVKQATLGQGQEKVSIAEQNANTAAGRAAAAAQAAMTRAQIAQENATTAAQKAKADAAYKAAEIKLKKAQSSSPKLTATSIRDAGKLAEDLYHGVTKPTASGGTEVVSYSQTYQDAIKTMMSQYPELGRAKIVKLINRWYPAGGKFPDGTPNGRPAQGDSAKAVKTAQQVGAKAFPSPFAGLTSGG